MDKLDVINYKFPYVWDKENMPGEPKVNGLLIALIERDYKTAKERLAHGETFHNIDKTTFQRCLFEFVLDYDLIKFMIDNGFTGINAYCIPWIFMKDDECIDSRGYTWSLAGRAFMWKKYDIMEMLFSAGFKGLSFWWKGNVHHLDRYSLRYNNFEMVDILLSHGYPKQKLINSISYDERGASQTFSYVMSNPIIKWKSYGLGDIFAKIIPPTKPEFSLFMLKKTKQRLLNEYNRALINYQNELVAQKEYIKTISRSDMEKYCKDKKGKEEFDKIADRIFAEIAEELANEIKIERRQQEEKCDSRNNVKSDSENSYKIYEENMKETRMKQMVFVDCSGAYRRWGDSFIDHKGNWCVWGSGFYDYDDNYIYWGNSYKDSSGAYRCWGDDFVDAAGNWVKTP